MKYEIEMDVDCSYLADVFFDHNWQWADGSVYGVPSEDDIRNKIGDLLKHMDEHRDLYVVQSSRLAVARNPEFPDSYEVFLCLGYADVNGDETNTAEVAS